MTTYDPNTLAVWIDRDDNVDWSKCQKHKPPIKVAYIDPRSGNAKAAAATCRANALVPGIYYSTSDDWFPGETLKQHAKRVSDYVQHAGIIVKGEPLMLDVEEKPLQWTNDFLVEVHKYLPTRPTSLTVGPGQDSSVVPCDPLAAFGWHLYVQLYGNAMQPAPAAQVSPTNKDLMRHGLPWQNIHDFYAGEAVPWNAVDGCIFTQRRLP